MDLNNVDNELQVKIFEVLKIILKEENTSITFEIPENDIVEMIIVSNGENTFKMIKYKETTEIEELNHKYYKLVPKKLKTKHKKLTDKLLLKGVLKIKVFNYLKPFLGNIVINRNIEDYQYILNYNDILLSLDNNTYDKHVFYIKNTYKLHQLTKLNKKLNIDQKFSIVFEEETLKNELYDNFYSIFQDIIKRPRK